MRDRERERDGTGEGQREREREIERERKRDVVNGFCEKNNQSSIKHKASRIKRTHQALPCVSITYIMTYKILTNLKL